MYLISINIKISLWDRRYIFYSFSTDRIFLFLTKSSITLILSWPVSADWIFYVPHLVRYRLVMYPIFTKLLTLTTPLLPSGEIGSTFRFFYGSSFLHFTSVLCFFLLSTTPFFFLIISFRFVCLRINLYRSPLLISNPVYPH